MIRVLFQWDKDYTNKYKFKLGGLYKDFRSFKRQNPSLEPILGV